MSQSLDRALTLLGGLAREPKTLDQLAEEIGVHKSTVLRLLRTLESHHFVRREGQRYYRLGSALFDLAQQALEDRDVRRTAQSALAALNVSTGHTVHLASYEDGEVVYIDKFEGRHSVRMYSRIGKRAPLHCTAVGKVLVAAMTPEKRADVVSRIDFFVRTPNTITTPAAYGTELDLVADRGYAVDNAEHEDFIHCIAAPVRGPGGVVLAAVSMSVPKVLLDYDGLMGLVPELVAAAEQASVHSGWTGNRKGKLE
ncbi:IclR family transcriptional regulator [Amycolatopsis sp. BJA-103]|uniref:IclR family transcriptional regulator n=1 Tax=unclassified Amycolatopsis TaxID=2618356 RepID=UPI000C781075|nr:IclR family transcriptional regulator [Amycolatopsis sp. BJA-103]AUI59881.1 IclR family transcriptional regulator [Amycolatopsis sp. BJA-103]PNE13767.1 IclR family transcriptional regulator [Amycolatopsis sp. BJA-103]